MDTWVTYSDSGEYVRLVHLHSMVWAVNSSCSVVEGHVSLAQAKDTYGDAQAGLLDTEIEAGLLLRRLGGGVKDWTAKMDA
ncbi:uncharacterized protein SETTUDRAFT_164774 [Exserohilum turcica Et28A]|uniref:Uncharacterized protein n=1 Tax=Exserohilum turcicum (strain 28A) TaxID=671987 RepID=R0JQ96_EXST2|nr:uncharacterized protein SETTUDRAFT_164774 [Exserohilum turcica Et28A]EOA83353.1 hypothetical protein SETTUDRAFT_164774 [Exserohilum turcica Et28A]